MIKYIIAMQNQKKSLKFVHNRNFNRYNFIFFFIYTIFQEGDTFGMKAILPCGPQNIKHI